MDDIFIKISKKDFMELVQNNESIFIGAYKHEVPTDLLYDNNNKIEAMRQSNQIPPNATRIGRKYGKGIKFTGSDGESQLDLSDASFNNGGSTNTRVFNLKNTNIFIVLQHNVVNMGSEYDQTDNYMYYYVLR